MFRHIRNRILFSYFLVLLSCLLITLLILSVFIRKMYFSFTLEDLKDDAMLFVDEFSKEAIMRQDKNFLKRLLAKAEKSYDIDFLDPHGTILANSKGKSYHQPRPLDQDEFKDRSPPKGYGYTIRQGDDGVERFYVAISIMEQDKRIGFVRISTPLGDIEKAIVKLKSYVVWIFVLAMLGSFLISFFLAKGISSPLLEMAKVAKVVSSGRLEMKAKIKNKEDEIGILADAFSDMIERLKKNQEEREKIFSNIAHELMTPITTIRGFMETILDAKLKDKKEVEECLEVIKRESSYLEDLIEELRFISQIDALSLKYDFRSINVIEVVLEAEKSLRLKANEKGMVMNNDFPLESFYIQADYNGLRQVFINLLDNAIKYSFPGTSVLVAIRRQDKFLKVAVEDKGIGISPADREKIFERFYRVEDGVHTEKGLGLGLSIVKEIILAHKAHLEVESQLHQGSRFIVILPIG